MYPENVLFRFKKTKVSYVDFTKREKIYALYQETIVRLPVINRIANPLLVIEPKEGYNPRSITMFEIPVFYSDRRSIYMLYNKIYQKRKVSYIRPNIICALGINVSTCDIGTLESQRNTEEIENVNNLLVCHINLHKVPF